MGEFEGLGIDGLGVPGDEARRPSDVAGFVPLVTREEVLTREELVDGCALVGGGGNHGLEIGDGDGDVVAVETQNEPAQGDRVGAEDGLFG